MGRISELIAAAPTLETPLTRRIHGFSRILLFAILGLAAVSFGVGVRYGEAPIEMFKAAVALAVGAIPEGLSVAVTIIMAIGVARMAERRAIIRSPPRGRDPRKHHGDLHGQDGDTDSEPDDGTARRGGR